MSKRLIAWLSLVLFCIVGIAAALVAANVYSLTLGIVLLLIFTGGFFVCMENMRNATDTYFGKETSRG